jgi:hypothetical protein
MPSSRERAVGTGQAAEGETAEGSRGREGDAQDDASGGAPGARQLPAEVSAVPAREETRRYALSATIGKTDFRFHPIVVLGVTLAALASVLAPATPSAEPMSAKVTASDAVSGMVTAVQAAGGQTIQFEVSSPSMLRLVKMGQAVRADCATRRATAGVAGAEPASGRTHVEGVTQVASDKLEIREGHAFKRTSPSCGSVAQALAGGPGGEAGVSCVGSRGSYSMKRIFVSAKGSSS